MGRGPKGQKRRLKPFVAMDKGMLRSDVFKGLSSSAKVTYLYLCLDQNADPDKPLRLPYSQGAELMDPKTLAQAFRELQERGFVERTQQGGLYNQCAEYRLTDGWRTWKPLEGADRKKVQRGKITTAKGGNPPLEGRQGRGVNGGNPPLSGLS